MTISFTVHGKPQPQGSTRAFTPKGWKRPIITSTNKSLKPWRQDTSVMAIEAMQKCGAIMATGPVRVDITFCYARPKTVKATHKITAPDIDKAVRSIFDSMSGIVFKDDAQVIELRATKQFGLPERATVIVDWVDEVSR